MKLDEAVAIDEGVREFVPWALGALGFSAVAAKHDGATFEVPERHREFFRGANVVHLVYGGAASSPSGTRQTAVARGEPLADDEATPVPADDSFLIWLMDQLQRAANVPYAVPTAPPLRVHEISARLFQAYTVDGGTLHLSGCTLEDRPLLRQTWLVSGDFKPSRLVHRFSDPRGVTLPEVEAAALGLHELQAPTGSLPLLDQEDVQAWCAAAQQHMTTLGEAIPAGAATAASVVWCQYAAGKIEFVIGEAAAEVAFSGWTRQLERGLVDPPALQCPVTGIRSHAIAATDDGRITAREAIQTCAQCGRRVLICELSPCEQTGQMVLPEYLATCPVSGQQILESALQACRTCQQAVSPACLEDGICAACRTLRPVRKDDPRMARVLGEFPGLDRWRNWRISETSTSYVLVAAALIKRLLVVVNKENLEAVRLATRLRFSSHWAEPSPSERQDFLG